MSLLTNLVAYYKCDESSGDAADATGNGRTMANQGTATFSTGLINNAADLGAINVTKYFKRTDGLGTSGNGNLSISGWVKLQTEVAAGVYHLFEVDSQTGADRYAVCQYEFNTGTRRVVWNCGGATVAKTITLGTSGWHHIVCLRTGTTGMELYVDGVSAGTSTPSTGTEGAANSSFGGDAFNGNNKASALFDEIGIWTRVLTSTEIGSLYNSGAGLAYPLSVNSPSISLSPSSSVSSSVSKSPSASQSPSSSVSLSVSLSPSVSVSLSISPSPSSSVSLSPSSSQSPSSSVSLSPSSSISASISSSVSASQSPSSSTSLSISPSPSSSVSLSISLSPSASVSKSPSASQSPSSSVSSSASPSAGAYGGILYRWSGTAWVKSTLQTFLG